LQFDQNKCSKFEHDHLIERVSKLIAT